MRSSLAASALLVAISTAGCSEELGPETYPTTTASGRVLASGRPVAGGWIEFQPFDGTLGDLTSARIGPDGSFRFEHAPVGEVAVRLVDLPMDLGGAVWLFRNGSPIRRKTASPEGPPMTIDVADELLMYQAKRSGGAR